MLKSTPTGGNDLWDTVKFWKRALGLIFSRGPYYCTWRGLFLEFYGIILIIKRETAWYLQNSRLFILVMPPLSDVYIPKTNQLRTAIFRISVTVFFISAPQLDKLKVHTVILTTLTSTLRGVPLSSFKRKSWMRAGTNGASFVLPIMKNNKYTSKVYMENKTNLSFFNNKIMACKNACSFVKLMLYSWRGPGNSCEATFGCCLPFWQINLLKSKGFGQILPHWYKHPTSCFHVLFCFK